MDSPIFELEEFIFWEGENRRMFTKFYMWIEGHMEIMHGFIFWLDKNSGC